MESVDPITTTTTRSGRVSKPPSRLQDYVVYQATQKIKEVHPETEYLSPTQYANNNEPVLALAASTDPDTLYLHQAMQEVDRTQFL
jgi:hypothetical protein